MTVYSDVEKHFRLQPIARIDVADPVQGQWYTVVEVRGPARIISMMMRQDNEPGSAQDIEARLTIDGLVLSKADDGVSSGTWNHYWVNLEDENLGSTSARVNAGYYTAIHVRSHFKFEIRLRSAGDTGQYIRGRVRYEKLE